MLIGQDMLWRQFDTALDALGAALRACPDALWQEQLWPDEPGQFVAAGFASFWYLGYHTLFWLDVYLTGTEEGFAPPAPFALVEMEEGESLPRVYGRDELLGYLALGRSRCAATISALTPEAALRPCAFAWGELPFGELLLYNLRHVQEHAAHLHMFLGQRRLTDPSR
ncbi:MAG TPA: DinB family protein [Herpetosiphonaceae bacterium]